MDSIKVVQGFLLPFLGTALGSACVFFMKRMLSRSVQRALTGFAAGVMVAASIWSLLIPAMEQSVDMEKLSFLPAFLGFWLGILFLLALDSAIPHLHMYADKAEGPKSSLQRTTMMVLAVTLHNIPEGMAVGVVYAGWLSGSAEITAGGAMFYVVVEELIPEMSERAASKREAEADKAQEGLEKDRAGNGYHDLRDQGARDVRQDLPEEDEGVSCAECARSLNEFLILQPQSRWR